MKELNKNNPLFVGSVEKAFAVFEAFDANTPSLSLTELVQRTAMTKSAAQRYVYTLESMGYLSKNRVSKRYELSLKALLPASSFLSQNTLVSAANLHIVQLRQDLDARVGLSVLHGGKVVYLIPLQSISEAYANDYPGFTVPLYCTTSGRTFLSYQAEKTAVELLSSENRIPVTPHTITDMESIMNEVKEVRKKGYCITNQEISLGKLNISVPVLDREQNAIACIVAVFKTQSWNIETLVHDAWPVLQEAAARIRIPSSNSG